MDKYLLPLQERKFYHIYNQGNNHENIFHNDGNYVYFLQKLDYYLSDFVELYAFCLMPNHFHLLIRIKTIEELEKTANEKFSAFHVTRLSKFQKLGKSKSRTNSEIYSDFISTQFRFFFMSYSKSINKQSERVGSLFRKNFKRKEITSLPYLQQAIIYIHRNPTHHKFCDDFTTYRWSSYSKITEEKITKLKKKEVLKWFDDKENYHFAHNQNVEDDIE